MTIRLALLISAIFALLAPPALAAPVSPSPDLAAVSAHLRAVDTMVANFTQTDRTGKVLAGTLTLKRPGRIRFQYQKGVPLLVVGDGKALTVIDYAVRQVSRWPIGNSPLGILLDPAKDLSRIARVVPTPDPRDLLIEARDPRHPEYGTISIGFVRRADAPAGLMLEGWTVLDAQNNRTTIHLAGQRFNMAVSDGTFRWDDPRPSGPRH